MTTITETALAALTGRIADLERQLDAQAADLVAQLHTFAQHEEAASKDQGNSDHWRGYKEGKADGFALAAQWIERDVMGLR